VQGMAAEGNTYTGFLYAGLMIGDDGNVKVLEYNCRFGDPETQPIMMRLKSDLVELCQAAIDGKLDCVHAQWDERAAVGIVMAAGGYPNDYRKGDIIHHLPAPGSADARVFHAGTRLQGQQVVTNGGRVLCATALGHSVLEARQRAYGLVEQIQWDQAYYRTDIGYRAIAREQTAR
jgi:phosphoribosylamine--glycine ligase